MSPRHNQRFLSVLAFLVALVVVAFVSTWISGEPFIVRFVDITIDGEVVR